MNNNQLNYDQLNSNQTNNIQNNPNLIPNPNVQGVNASPQNIIPNATAQVSAPIGQNNMANIQPTVQNGAPAPMPTFTGPIQSNNVSGVPIVDQSRDSFVQNTQQSSIEKQDEHKKGINYMLVIVLFIIILATIFFIFPLLRRYI